jgi:glycosyltransferase involved in cell wall biosynthesis
MVALEALACGTPVAATRVGAMEELLRNPANGRLAKDLHPQSLAAAIEDLLPPGAAARRQTEAVRRSVLDYSWSHVASGIWRVYRSSQAGAEGAPAAVAAGLHHPHDGRRTCCGCGAFTPA